MFVWGRGDRYWQMTKTVLPSAWAHYYVKSNRTYAFNRNAIIRAVWVIRFVVRLSVCLQTVTSQLECSSIAGRRPNDKKCHVDYCNDVKWSVLCGTKRCSSVVMNFVSQFLRFAEFPTLQFIFLNKLYVRRVVILWTLYHAPCLNLSFAWPRALPLTLTCSMSVTGRLGNNACTKYVFSKSSHSWGTSQFLYRSQRRSDGRK